MSTAAGASVSRSTSHRHQPGSSRAAPSPSAPPRSQSQSYRAPSAPSQSGSNNVANVARRDFEQSNVAAPASTHRSGSRDRAAASSSSQPSRADSTRGQRQSSRSDTGRYASIDAAAAQQPPTNGVVRDAGSHAIPPTGGRRRTTITASTGTWMLGKTIGAGSMGKVKLAKNAETGEQVRN